MIRQLGTFPLRLSLSLKQAGERVSAQDGTSMNRFLVVAVGENWLPCGQRCFSPNGALALPRPMICWSRWEVITDKGAARMATWWSELHFVIASRLFAAKQPRGSGELLREEKGKKMVYQAHQEGINITKKKRIPFHFSS